MLVTVYFEKEFPNRVISVIPYSNTTSPCFIPGIDIRLKFLNEHEKPVLENPTAWVWTINSGIGLGPALTDTEKDRCNVLAKKLKLIERLWVMSLILDRSIYRNMLGSEIHENLMQWEIKNDVQGDPNSLTSYMSSKMNTDIQTYSTIYQINKDTYYNKSKELYVSILKIQDMIMESSNPESVYRVETSRLFSQPKK
jgi:hypothetical protein